MQGSGPCPAAPDGEDPAGELSGPWRNPVVFNDRDDMSSWDYRIVRYRNGSGFGLHEVYYDKDGQPWAMTERPASFACDVEEGSDGVVRSLGMAHTAALKRPVLDEPEKWPGKTPPPSF